LQRVWGLLAYFECWYEVKLIADTMIKMGPEKFFELISPNALIGSEVAREIFFDKEYFEKLEKLANEVKDKSFTKKIENSDFNQIKEKVVSFWRNQEINQVHKEIGHDLYK
jgi:ketol-acid reductoisomerase